jgi:phage gpG-like protein
MSKITTIKNFDNITRLQKTLHKHKTEHSQGFVGIVGAGKPRSDGASNIQLAIIHEFGFPEDNIPRRSFLIDTIEHKKNEIQKDALSIYSMFVRGKISRPIAKLMLRIKGYVDDAFSTSGFGKWQKNADYTISQKKSDKPLIDKGFLSDSISFTTSK